MELVVQQVNSAPQCVGPAGKYGIAFDFRRCLKKNHAHLIKLNNVNIRFCQVWARGCHLQPLQCSLSVYDMFTFVHHSM
jgi:hypothetical protein